MKTETPAVKPSLLLRQRLICQLTDEIRGRGWTPKECEKLLGMRQARVSELLNRKTEAFSLDKLTDIAHAMGCRVETALVRGLSDHLRGNVA